MSFLNLLDLFFRQPETEFGQLQCGGGTAHVGGKIEYVSLAGGCEKMLCGFAGNGVYQGGNKQCEVGRPDVGDDIGLGGKSELGEEEKEVDEFVEMADGWRRLVAAFVKDQAVYASQKPTECGNGPFVAWDGGHVSGCLNVGVKWMFN